MVRIPPHFNDFRPPPKGGSYTDAQYGCRVLRLTDGNVQFHEAVHHQYATISAVNEDDSMVMLLTGSGKNLVIDMLGNVMIGPADFPAVNSGNIPWDRHFANAFYYTQANTLFKATVSRNKVISRALHRFADYARVVIPDDEDLSDDGDHLWLVGGTQAFLYTISTDTVGPSISVGEQDQGCSWHKLQITPSNGLLVTWACNGKESGQGQEVYSPEGGLHWHMFNSSVHTEVGRDLSGREVAIVSRIPDTHKDVCPSRGGIDLIQLDPPHKVICLVDVNWAATHISYRDPVQGWVAVSFFDQGACPDYSCFDPGRLSPKWQSTWKHFYEEIILAKIDGSAVIRLVHHRSRSAEYYWAQSRASISRDARYVVFDSNMNRADTGLNEYTDVYVVKVQ